MTEITNQSPNSAASIAFKDMFKPEFLILSAIPFAVVAIVGILMVLFIGSGVAEFITQGVNNLENVDTGYRIINWMLKFLASSYLAGILTAIIYFVFGGILVVFFNTAATMVAGMLAPFVVKYVLREHYPDFKPAKGLSMFGSFLTLMEYAIIMCVMFVLFIPLFFVPIIGLIAFYLPFWYFFHKTILMDTWDVVPDRKKVYKNHRGKIRITTMGMFTLASVLPVVGVFLQIYYFTVMTHMGILASKEAKVNRFAMEDN